MQLLRNPIVLASLFVVVAIVVVSCTIPVTPTQSESTGASGAAGEPDAAAAQPQAGVMGGSALLPAEDPPGRILGSNWTTDFSRRTVEWSEIMSGGPPKDGIPAIDDPTIENIEEAAEWLSDRDPVIVFENDGEARAYPLAILIWHEIVNDEVGGRPVAVTFCPLCNASIVFDRNFNGQVLDFGTTGLLRNSDLVMYDRQSETWWQQFVGQGIVGEHAGEQLTFLPSQVVSFEDFRSRFPDSPVLARPPAARSYGVNPYTNYDSTTGRPFLYSGELDTRLASTERVVGMELHGETMAYPFSVLADEQVVNDEVGGIPIAVFHKSGTASALDSRDISEGKDVGSAAVFDRTVNDRVLTFEASDGGAFRDLETGSTWNIFGEAVDGELAGQKLEQVLSFDHFWFAWTAFFPDTGLYEG
jgi:hypothetical protein